MKIFGKKPKPDPRPKISLLFPFKSDDKHRLRVFKWVLDYWKCQLPDAEIIVGQSKSHPFCKTEALNDAASRAHGKVIVIIDADAYMDAAVIDKCADLILDNLDEHLWFVPYRHLYRLNKPMTLDIIQAEPCAPFQMPDIPPKHWIDGDWTKSSYGHRYGAMIMMFPREALEVIGCFDERFRGWGGEDVALLRALDTLWGKHKTTKNPLFHLWHPYIGNSYISRVWRGQSRPQLNKELANKYHKASRHPAKMRELIDEGCHYHRKRKRHPKYVLMNLWERLTKPHKVK